MDDLLLGISLDFTVPIQAKSALDVRERVDSDFASALDQCVRQHFRDPDSRFHRDLLIVSGERTSVAVAERLPLLLQRLRVANRYSSAKAAAMGSPKDERILETFLAHVRRSWRTQVAQRDGVGTDAVSEPTDAELSPFFTRVRFAVVDVEEGGGHESAAKNLLRQTVLRNAEQAEVAWGCLIRTLVRLSGGRATFGRADLRRALSEAGIELKVPLEFQEDVARVRAYTRRTLGFLAQRAEIRVGEQKVRLKRHVTGALRAAA